jgi:hypothetical protein
MHTGLYCKCEGVKKKGNINKKLQQIMRNIIKGTSNDHEQKICLNIILVLFKKN